MQDITKDTPKMETLVDTELQDLRISDKHAAIPKWLRKPATHGELARLTYDETSPLGLRRDAELLSQPGRTDLVWIDE